MYISSTANNRPLIYKCPRQAQSHGRGAGATPVPGPAGGTLPTAPARRSPVPGRWTSRGWDAGWAVSIASRCPGCGVGSWVPCSALLGTEREGWGVPGTW